MSYLTTILHEKRALLMMQSAQQRQQLAGNLAPLKRPLALVDSAIRTVKFVHQHPWLMIGAGFVMGNFRVTSLIHTFNKLKLVWNGYEKLQRMIKRS